MVFDIQVFYASIFLFVQLWDLLFMYAAFILLYLYSVFKHFIRLSIQNIGLFWDSLLFHALTLLVKLACEFNLC